MIRHSSSFLISLILHSILAFSIFYVYNTITYNEVIEEKKVQINLCCLPEQVPKPLKKIQKELPKQKPKIVTPKPVIKKKPIKQQPKPIPKPKKQVIIDKPIKPKIDKPVITEPIKEKIEPPLKEEVNPLPLPQIKEEIVVVKTEPLPEIKKEPIINKESPIEKNTRLEREYLNENIQKITKLLSENLYYPRSARKRNIQGNVVVKFRLSRNAQVDMIEIVSSKSEILSRAAIKTIEDLSDKFPKPAQELILHVPITYKLNR
ncbi:TonB family protein [Sulfurimonas sp.]|nr:TonB family protein [Sulfurimonas sp.]